MSSHTLDPELRDELESLAKQQGCELLSMELAGGSLRVVLDREDGVVGIEDCTAVSRQASALLDAYDFGERRYLLEVSSPGLDRPLHGSRDYQRFAGQLARFTFSDPETGQKRTVVGQMELTEPEKVALTDRETGAVTLIPLDRVQAARLEIDL